MNADRTDPSHRASPRPPLRDHVANSVRRYLRDLDGCGAKDLYGIALRELEIPLFQEDISLIEKYHAAPKLAKVEDGLKILLDTFSFGANISTSHPV